MMKIKPRFNQSIIAGLILISAVIILLSSILIKKVNEKDYLSKKITKINHPSAIYLNDLSHLYIQSKNLSISCYTSNTPDDSLFREKYKKLFLSEITRVLDNLTGLSVHWEPDDKAIFAATSLLIRDSLFYTYQNLISQIHSDKIPIPDLIRPEKLQEQINMIPLFQKIDNNLKYLLDSQQQEMTLNTAIMHENSSLVRKMIRYSALTFIAIFFISILLILIYINKFFKKFTSHLEMLSLGIIPPKISVEQDDHRGKTFSSLNKLIDYFNRILFILKKILNKEFDADFTPAGAGDEPGNTILDIQKSLKLTNEEQQKHLKEESERIWTAEGTARINEILRKSSDKPEDLGYKVIRKIVEYTVSRAGAIFLVNQSEGNETFIEQLASYAFDRKKQQEKKLAPGEGLIGRCINENKTICLADVPKGYLKIKSGMGEADPVSILIVPFHLNEKVSGVIELASFSLFDPYKIKFVEIIGDSLASALSKLQINIQTTLLLAQTKAQAEQMAAQKEEMQRNYEELRITKELLSQKEVKLKKEIEILRQQSGNK